MGTFNPEEVKCVTSGRHLTPCSWLAKALEYGHPTAKAKGLYKPDRVILSTREKGTDVVQLHSGQFIGRGAALNYCPFCGEDIRTWAAPDSRMTTPNAETDQ